jgi:hypothetical protein
MRTPMKIARSATMAALFSSLAACAQDYQGGGVLQGGESDYGMLEGVPPGYGDPQRYQSGYQPYPPPLGYEQSFVYQGGRYFYSRPPPDRDDPRDRDYRRWGEEEERRRHEQQLQFREGGNRRDNEIVQRQEGYNRAVTQLQEQYNHGLVAQQQQFNQGRLPRLQMNANIGQLQRQMNEGISQQRRALPH